MEEGMQLPTQLNSYDTIEKGTAQEVLKPL